MASLAPAYSSDARRQGLVLDGLEKSFHSLCLALKISDEFAAFRDEQERILEGGR